jgi:hypothetical protein
MKCSLLGANRVKRNYANLSNKNQIKKTVNYSKHLKQALNLFHESLSKNHPLLVLEDVERHSCDLLLRPNEAVVTDRWQEN